MKPADKKKMAGIVLLIIAILNLGRTAQLCAEAIVQKQRLELPFAAVVSVPCALNGEGEDVALSGTTDLQTQLVTDTSGGIHFDSLSAPNGNVIGVGMRSGVRYNATGVTKQSLFFSGPLPLGLTIVNSFKIIGPGPDNNLLVQQTLRITINANGEVTASVDRMSAKCQ